jgi:hypothetical protein
LKHGRGWVPHPFRALAFLFLFVATLSAQEITLHMDVHLVNVFVNVTDRNGAIVGGLDRQSFALFEDGRPQQIALFERQSELTPVAACTKIWWKKPAPPVALLTPCSALKTR